MSPLDALEVVHAHLEHLRLRNLRPNTITQRGLHLRRLRTALGVELLDATADQLAVWYSTLDMTPETRAGYLSHVHCFYTWAVLEHRIDVDPTVSLARPRIPGRLPRPMPDSQLRDALDHAPERVRPWLFLAAFAGLRACEVAQLRRQDVLDDTDPPVLIVVNGKGGKQRVVPLAPQVAKALHDYGMPATGYVFERRDGSRGSIPAHLVSQHANRYLHELGIKHTFHSLRHFFGTALYRESRDLRLTQEVMGHASPLSTAGYAAWSPEIAVGMVNRITLRHE